MARLTDLSRGGGYVETMAGFRVGDRVDLEFTLDKIEVSLTARVVHCRAGHGFGFEVDVERLTDLTRHAVAAFLENDRP